MITKNRIVPIIKNGIITEVRPPGDNATFFVGERTFTFDVRHRCYPQLQSDERYHEFELWLFNSKDFEKFITTVENNSKKIDAIHSDNEFGKHESNVDSYFFIKIESPTILLGVEEKTDLINQKFIVLYLKTLKTNHNKI